MYGRANMVAMRGFRMDPSITKQKLKPGTIRRIAAYARPYRMYLIVFLLATAVDARWRHAPDRGGVTSSWRQHPSRSHPGVLA